MRAHRVTESARAAPIVKWAGGKTRLLPELIARVPDQFERYYEPFAGGAALFFRLQPYSAMLGDANRDLIATYEAVCRYPEEVIGVLRGYQDAHCEEVYYGVRCDWNDGHLTEPIVCAAAFIYLNKTCFNGLWRVNRAGAFNVPVGRYTNPPICAPDAVRAASAALTGAQLRCGDYAMTAADARRGDFVYFDPPYDGTFVGYTGDGFGAEQQERLALTVRLLVSIGCKVMVSNSDTPRIRELYDGMRIDVVRCPRAINSKTSKRGAVDEVIVTAGYEVRA